MAKFKQQFSKFAQTGTLGAENLIDSPKSDSSYRRRKVEKKDYHKIAIENNFLKQQQ